MATGGDSSVVTNQPKSRRKEIEEFVRELDPLQVGGQFVYCVPYTVLSAILLLVDCLVNIRKIVKNNISKCTASLN